MILREVLHAHIPTLTPRSSIRDAVDKMDVYQFPALVIVDESEKPLAVITEGDICRAISRMGSISSMSDTPATDYASQNPTTSSPDTEIGDALHLMLMRSLTVLPVVEIDRLLGIVLRVDLMQALLMDRRPSHASNP